jgi:hypothetical protein
MVARLEEKNQKRKTEIERLTLLTDRKGKGMEADEVPALHKKLEEAEEKLRSAVREMMTVDDPSTDRPYLKTARGEPDPEGSPGGPGSSSNFWCIRHFVTDHRRITAQN